MSAKFEFSDTTGNVADIDESQVTPRYFSTDPAASLEAVIGVDNRVKIVDTSIMPYKAIAKLYMRTKTGSNLIGSAWLISPNKLITAGHCVHDARFGGWMESIRVVPGMSGVSRPFGEYEAEAMMATKVWLSSATPRYDMGAIKLKTDVSHTDFITPELTDANEATVCGYPADRDTGIFQYSMREMIRKTADGTFRYTIDTFGGQSGSPLLSNAGTSIGIHNYGGAENSASDLTRDFLDRVLKW